MLSPDILLYALWALGAYLLGSVSFGDIVARLAGFEIRESGTGNPGAANVFRQVGRRWSVVVFALDFGKGFVVMVPALVLDLPVWAGMVGAAGVLLGHFLPVFWCFRGGTGMVVGMGVCFGLAPLGALVAAPLPLLILLLSRNAGYTGAAFFFGASILGWVLADEASVFVMTLLVAGSVLAKSLVQYGTFGNR